MLLQGTEDLPDGPIDLHDHIAVEPLLRLALELVRNVQRHVRHAVRYVQEKRPGLVLLDERDRPLGVPGGQPGLVGVVGDGLFPLDQWQRRVAARGRGGMLGPHVIGIGQAEVVIEAVAGGQEPGMVAQVPLAVDGGGVTALLDHLGDGRFVVVDAMF